MWYLVFHVLSSHPYEDVFKIRAGRYSFQKFEDTVFKWILAKIWAVNNFYYCVNDYLRYFLVYKCNV